MLQANHDAVLCKQRTKDRDQLAVESVPCRRQQPSTVAGRAHVTNEGLKPRPALAAATTGENVRLDGDRCSRAARAANGGHDRAAVVRALVTRHEPRIDLYLGLGTRHVTARHDPHVPGTR